MSGTMDGVALIAEERERQRERWGDEHDDAHTAGQIAWAAVCYAAPNGRVFRLVNRAAQMIFKDPWPWHNRDDARKLVGGNVPEWQPDTGPHRIRMLVKAGALIAAEIDRLRRQ